jgi:hypothetical protein
MRVSEENCNMMLLAAVTAFSLAVAGVATVLEPAPALSLQVEASNKPVYVADQTPVRVIGTPFVPNTNPRER